MKPFFDPKYFNWKSLQSIPNRAYVCGYCGDRVSTDRGYALAKKSDASGPTVGGTYICPNCHGPTFFPEGGKCFPAPAMGNRVSNLPHHLHAVYEEARQCTSHRCFTAAVLLCRKLLMNIAVDKGADKGLRFVPYVEYLSEKGYTPPDGRGWVDHIRKKGNEATHEIAMMSEQDARDLLVFAEMLLRFVYEFPKMVPPQQEGK